MTRLALLSLPALGALLTGCGATEPVPLARPERIVLVTIDTLRADAVGAYGGTVARTRTLDALAAGGTRFEEAISPAPLTLPSHASIMTGLAPPQHGVHDNSIFRLSDDVPTLAERLRDAGYATAAVVGALVLDRQFGLARGFDHYDDELGEPGQAGPEVPAFPERKASAVVAAARAWLEQAPDRFFLWIHLYDPHAPYVAPMWQAVPDDRVRYCDEVTYADDALGRLLDDVAARWPGAGTLVVATSDHGESLGQHGEGTHSLGIYEATQRVPLIFQGLGIPAGRVVEGVARLTDLAPTILALAGLESLPGAVGADLSPVLGGGDLEPRAAYLETLATRIGWGWSPLFGVRSDRYKYIRAPRPELYDLDADPHERVNLLPGSEDVAAELDAVLEARLADARPVRSNLAPGDEDTRMLESLGYVVGESVGDDLELGRVEGADPKDKLGVRQEIRAATRLMLDGRFREALVQFEAIDDVSPNLDGYRAVCALESGRLDAALRYAQRSLAGDPLQYSAHNLLGRVLLARGEYEAAEQAFAAALRIDPKAGSDALELGKLAERRGDRETAAKHYALATRGRRVPGEARWRLAALRIEQGRTEEAKALLAELGPPARLPPEASARLAQAEDRARRAGAQPTSSPSVQ